MDCYGSAGTCSPECLGQRVLIPTVVKTGFIIMIDQEDRDCPDCAVKPHEAHLSGCDVARCLWTGLQRLMCRQEYHSCCGEDIWSGEWPGYEECRQYKLWCYWQPPAPDDSSGEFVPCGEDHPNALADLNALQRCGIWDRELKRWMILDGVVR